MFAGFEIVLAKREVRKDGYLKKLFSRSFYKLFNYLSGIKANSEVANFGIYHKKVIKSILSINDNIKFFPLFINWVGFKSISINVEHKEREQGKSSYSIFKLISLAFNTIISFSEKPLKLFTSLGLIISLFSVVFGFYFFVQYLTGKITEPGFTSIILSIWFLSGVIISTIGIVGIYLGKTFNQTKNRPVFIIDEINGN